MKSRYKVILGICISVVLVIFWHVRFSNITKISSFAEIDFSDVTHDTLVCFDVDETLIAPVDSFLDQQYSLQGMTFTKQLPKYYPEIHDWDELHSILLLQAQRPLIEANVVQIIKHLQQRNVPVIMFTYMNTGPIGLISSKESWRYEHLKSLGIEGSFADKKLKFSYNNKKPVFYKGILCSDLSPKGNILGLFLDAIDYTPKKVVMIDDELSFVQSVEKECLKRNIAFKGYHYRGHSKKKWDQKIIDFQVRYLIKNKTWLSDTQVEALLEKSDIVTV